MSKQAGIKRLVTPVPQNLDEAAKFLRSIGQEQRKIDGIHSTLNQEIDALQSKLMDDAKPHEEKISQLVEGLFAFAESNRDKLTDSGKRKSVELPTGLFGWRMTPPAVSLRDVKSVLASLKSLGLKRFIRTITKKEVNKEAMLKEIELAMTVKGVSISQREEFIVKPTELEVEIVSDIKKLKKTVS